MWETPNLPFNLSFKVKKEKIRQFGVCRWSTERKQWALDTNQDLLIKLTHTHTPPHPHRHTHKHTDLSNYAKRMTDNGGRWQAIQNNMVVGGSVVRHIQHRWLFWLLWRLVHLPNVQRLNDGRNKAAQEVPVYISEINYIYCSCFNSSHVVLKEHSFHKYQLVLCLFPSFCSSCFGCFSQKYWHLKCFSKLSYNFGFVVRDVTVALSFGLQSVIASSLWVLSFKSACISAKCLQNNVATLKNKTKTFISHISWQNGTRRQELTLDELIIHHEWHNTILNVCQSLRLLLPCAVKSHMWRCEEQSWDARVKRLQDRNQSLLLSLGYLPPPFNVSVPIFSFSLASTARLHSQIDLGLPPEGVTAWACGHFVSICL